MEAQQHSRHMRVKVAELAVTSGIVVTLISLIYSNRWATLTIFKQGSAGLGYGYPFSYIVSVSYGQAPSLSLAVTNNLYIGLLPLILDLATWIPVAVIITFSVATVMFNEKARPGVYYSLLLAIATLLVTLVLNFGGSIMPETGAPLPYLEYSVNANVLSLMTDPPFIYSGIVIPNLIFDLCFIYVLFFSSLNLLMGRRAALPSEN